MAKEDKDIEIVHLKFPENIRKRPGMYIGGIDNADVILREVIDNSIDELFNCKNCNTVISNKQGDWYVTSDNGRGIPIYITEEGITAAELACSSLHAGSKFDKTLSSASIGLNGVGIKATNALSEKFIILSRVTIDNHTTSIHEVEGAPFKSDEPYHFYYIEFEKGIKTGEGCIGALKAFEKFGFEFPTDASTVTAFIPDKSIFKDVKASYPKKNMLYVKTVTEKFYGKTVKIILNGEEASSEFEPYQLQFMKWISISDYTGREKTAQFYVNFELDSNMSVMDITGSINSLPVDLGLHLRIAKDAYSDALSKCYNLGHNYTLNGLKMNVIVMCGEVDFASQTKERCTKLDDLTPNECIPELSKEFSKIIKANAEIFDGHVARLNEYAESLLQISTINKIKSMIVVAGEEGSRVRSKIPASVKDAASTDREKCELFIVEGKSAGGTIVKARDRNYQGVIELRGVPMNAINADLDTLLDNEEMKNIISAIGVGVNEHYNMDNPRYGKIIIAADADPDGLRIASLIAGMIAKKMTFLIERGMVYVLETALYRQGDLYIYPGEEELLDRSKGFKRYKGLGEINVDEAKIMITNQETRRLRQLTLDNVDHALSLLTSSFARKNLMIDSGVLIDPFNLGIFI